MTSFTFSLAQLLAAPPEVRRWAEVQIGAALAELGRNRPASVNGRILPYHAAGEFPLRRAAMQQPLLSPSAGFVPPFHTAAAPDFPAETGKLVDEGGAGHQQSAAPAIAACTAVEAVKLFGLLEADLPTAQVFFEFGRDTAASLPDQPLCVFTIGDVMRHARLGDGRQLLGCLRRINHAFQDLRGAQDLSLFGIDADGYLYVHVETQRSIHQLWTNLLALEAEKHPHPLEMPQQ